MGLRRNQIRKYLKANENKTTTYQNQWDAEKTVQKVKFIAINTYKNKIYILKNIYMHINNKYLLKNKRDLK